MLPKSHAIGGNSDFEIKYDDHTLMIEVTLTESTNQRRAEMESVSRHLGNILLTIAALSDFFDGYLARKLNATSVFGGKLDQLSDKQRMAFVLSRYEDLSQRKVQK